MADSTKSIPPELSDIFERLQSDVVWLHLRWALYRQLYGTNPERIDLLNNTAALFFQQLQLVLFHDVLLGLSRLTDCIKYRHRENLVLEQLCAKLDSSKHMDLHAVLSQRLTRIKQICDPFRKERNRRVAHRDLKGALNAAQNPLPGISRAMVEDTLKEIRNLMNVFQVFFTDSEMAYDHFVTDSGGDALIFALREAVAYEKLERNGKIPEDYLRLR